MSTLSQIIDEASPTFLHQDFYIYTDGSYKMSKSIGCAAFMAYLNDQLIFQYAKLFHNSTSQRMEMLAVIIALESLKYSTTLTIFTDSMYIVGTVTKGWKRNANHDLWNRMFTQLKRHKVSFQHVKGHSNNDKNNLVDKLSNSLY